MSGDDGLREAIARQLMWEYEQEYTVTGPVSDWYPDADAVLALPEVAALLAKAAAYAIAADRVRKLADRFDASPYTHSNRTTADRIRRALDGDGS